MQSYYSNLTSIILSLYVRWCHEGTVLYICRSVNIKKINCGLVLNLSRGIKEYNLIIKKNSFQNFYFMTNKEYLQKS